MVWGLKWLLKGGAFCLGRTLADRPLRVQPGVRGDTEFAVDFVLVGVGQELVEQAVGAFEFEDSVGRQQGREALLPVIMAAFDFVFGLRGGGEAQGPGVRRGPAGRALLPSGARRGGQRRGGRVDPAAERPSSRSSIGGPADLRMRLAPASRRSLSAAGHDGQGHPGHAPVGMGDGPVVI